MKSQITVVDHEDKITAITFHGENLEQITDHENTPCTIVECVASMCQLHHWSYRIFRVAHFPGYRNVFAMFFE